MSIFVTVLDDDAQYVRSVESADSASLSSSSEGSAASFFSDVLSTSSVSSRSGPDMNSFASPRSGGLQRSFSPSQNRASFYPEYYHPPTLIRPHIYKCAFAAAKCRLPSDNIPQHFLDTPGTIWVNKIPLVESLCPVISQLGNWLALIRRPSGYGKTAFIYTSGFLHDVLNERTAAHVFGPRASSFPYVRGDRLVLRIDLQTVFYDTSETMCSSVDAYLNAELHLPQATHTFDEILDLLTFSGYKLVLFIDNFNSPLLNSTPENCNDIHGRIWDCIICPLRSALEAGLVVGGVVLGTPIAEEPIWVRSSQASQSLFEHIARDVSDEERVRGAFGFTLPEVQELAAEALGEAEGIKFVDELKHSPAYRSGDYVEYSMEDVLGRLRSRTMSAGTIKRATAKESVVKDISLDGVL
ncbi:hypothetical protein BDZ89DRAFT_1164603 [Hymenopellis radicata]|nr:hypothetical protein BDZ89DRAFT_1164603 [Hymenopellis radicata]